jgi:hypothetical protein
MRIYDWKSLVPRNGTPGGSGEGAVVFALLGKCILEKESTVQLRIAAVMMRNRSTVFVEKELVIECIKILCSGLYACGLLHQHSGLKLEAR